MSRNLTWSLSKILGIVVGAAMLSLAAMSQGCELRCQEHASRIDGQCICDNDFAESAPGLCASMLEPCPNNMHRDASGVCSCRDGYVEAAPNVCKLVMPPCPPHEHPNASSNCECDEGTTRGASGECASFGPPDLTPTGLHMSGQRVGEEFQICLDQVNDYINIRSQGIGDTAPYKVALGLYNVTKGDVAGYCTIDVTNGTPAGSTTQISHVACCKIPRSAVPTGAQLAKFVYVGFEDSIKESNERNNMVMINHFIAPLCGSQACLAAALPGESMSAAWLASLLKSAPRFTLDEEK